MELEPKLEEPKPNHLRQSVHIHRNVLAKMIVLSNGKKSQTFNLLIVEKYTIPIPTLHFKTLLIY